MGDICPFLCDLFQDYKKRIKNQRYSLPFAVCRKRHAETLYSFLGFLNALGNHFAFKIRSLQVNLPWLLIL